MGKSLKFNGEAVTQSHRAPVSKYAATMYPSSQVSTDRGNQTRRQKRLKVSLAAVNIQEDK